MKLLTHALPMDLHPSGRNAEVDHAIAQVGSHGKYDVCRLEDAHNAAPATWQLCQKQNIGAANDESQRSLRAGTRA